jgi:hypothetical protein
MAGLMVGFALHDPLHLRQQLRSNRNLTSLEIRRAFTAVQLHDLSVDESAQIPNRRTEAY